MSATMQPYVVRLIRQGILVVLFAYGLALGGTFNGLLFPSLLTLSLAIVALLVTIWLVGVWHSGGLTLRGLHLPLIALWVVAYGVSAMLHPTGRVAIGVWFAAFYLGFWVILRNLLIRGLPPRAFVDAALVVAIPLNLFAWVQGVGWFVTWFAVRSELPVAFAPPRLSSVLGNPNALGCALAMLLPHAVARYRGSHWLIDRLMWSLWILGAGSTLFLTFSRGAWLSALVGLVLLLPSLGRGGTKNVESLLVFRSKRISLRRTFVVILVIAVVSVSLVSLTYQAFDTPRRGVSSRQEIYRAAVLAFSENPFAGVGPFEFGRTLMKEVSIPPEQPQSHAHSFPLNVAAELGILGIAAVLASAYVVLSRLFTDFERFGVRANSEKMAYGASVAVLVVHSLVDMVIMIPGMMLLALVVVAAWLPVGKAVLRPDESRRYRLLGAAVVSLWWGVLLVIGVRSAVNYSTYVNGERALVAGDYQAAIETLRFVVDDDPWLAFYRAELAYSYGLAAASGDDRAALQGVDAYRDALAREPEHAIWWANLAGLLWQQGDLDSALDAAENAVMRASEDANLWVYLGAMREHIGDNEGACSAYRTAFDLSPRLSLSSYWHTSDVRLECLTTSSVGQTLIMQGEALWRAGQGAHARRVLEESIHSDPSQSRPYYTIARILIGEGACDEARTYLDAAGLLARTEIDRAWVLFLESEWERQQGDLALSTRYLEEAKRLVLPQYTGQVLFYSRDVAYYQFLKLKVRGELLPQVTYLGVDPVLNDLIG